MELIAQIALGVIIGGLTIALVVIGFFVWPQQQHRSRHRASPFPRLYARLRASLEMAWLSANVPGDITAATRQSLRLWSSAYD